MSLQELALAYCQWFYQLLLRGVAGVRGWPGVHALLRSVRQECQARGFGGGGSLALKREGLLALWFPLGNSGSL